MSIARSVINEVACDHPDCGEHVKSAGANDDTVRHHLTRFGWSTTVVGAKVQDLCPQHSEAPDDL